MDYFKNRLSHYTSFNSGLWEAVEQLPSKPRILAPHEDIIRVGEKADKLFMMSDGWAIRYRTLPDGRRQIVNFMLPGDIFDLQALAGLEADHTVTAITRSRILEIDPARFMKVLTQSGEIASAFWWTAVQEESILREQIVRVGRRSAKERIGHLLLELHRRLSVALGSQDNRLILPVTRTDLADALGLTPVHVSRTMSWLRKTGMIEESRGIVFIRDHERLTRLAGFDDDYLHLRRLEISPPTEPPMPQRRAM